MVIDIREKKLIETLKKMEKGVQFIIKHEKLDVGDIQLRNIETQQIIIIERKTGDDLYNSILDSRYREQKARLLDSFDASQIIYIIEGECKKKDEKTKKIISGAKINTQFRDNIKIIETKDIENTKDILIQLFNKFSKDEFNSTQQKLEIRSKSKKVKDNFVINVLSLIPQISYSMAETICTKKRYNKLNDLISDLNDNGETTLENVMITNKRRFGKTMSKNVYNLLI